MKLFFEFNPLNADDAGLGVFEDASKNLVAFSLCDENSILKIFLERDFATVSAWIEFAVDLKPSVAARRFDRWAADNGGWSCGYILADEYETHIESDEGGALNLIVGPSGAKDVAV